MKFIDRILGKKIPVTPPITAAADQLSESAGRAILTKKLLQGISYNPFLPNVFQTTTNNPDPNIQNSDKGIAVYREMEMTHPKVRSSLRTRRHKLLNRKWEFLTPDKSKDPEDLKRRDFMTRNMMELNSSTWEGNNYIFGPNAFLTGVWRMLRDGYSGTQAMWNLTEARIVETEQCLPQVFTWGNNSGTNNFAGQYTGRTLYVSTEGNAMPVPAPKRKFIMGIYDSEDGNPHGASVLQPAYWPWKLSYLYAFKWWANSLNKYGEPSIIANIPREWWDDTTLRDAITDVLKTIQNGMVGTLPENPKTNAKIWELIETQRNSTADFFQGFMKFCDDWIVLAILGELLTTQEPTLGNRALGEVQGQQTGGAYIGADADANAAVINGQFTRWQCDMKFGTPQPSYQVINGQTISTPPRAYPVFTWMTDSAKDLKLLVDTLDVAKNSVDISDAWYREAVGIPPFDPKIDKPLKSTPQQQPFLGPTVFSESQRPIYRRLDPEQLDKDIEAFMRRGKTKT